MALPDYQSGLRHQKNFLKTLTSNESQSTALC